MRGELGVTTGIAFMNALTLYAVVIHAAYPYRVESTILKLSWPATERTRQQFHSLWLRLW